MEDKTLFDEDSFKYALLKGDDFNYNGLVIKNYRLNDIYDIGFREYYESLNILTYQLPKEAEELGITKFDVFTTNEKLTKDFIKFINLFIGHDIKNGIVPIPKFRTIMINNKKLIGEINSTNLNMVMELVRKMYGVPDKVPDSKNPNIPKKYASLLEEFEQETRRVQKAVKTDITMYSIIEAVACRGQYDMKTVWDLTMHQLMSTYRRYDVVSNYEQVMSGIYHATVDGSKIDFKKIHWARDIY